MPICRTIIPRPAQKPCSFIRARRFSWPICFCKRCGRESRTWPNCRSGIASTPSMPCFASVPGAGELIRPALLVKFGDDPQRFAHPSAVQALAGTSRSHGGAENRKPFVSALPANKDGAISVNNGRWGWSTRSGLRQPAPITPKSVLIAIRMSTPIAVSPIVGWRLPGNYGRPINPMMKHSIFSSVLLRSKPR